MSNMYDDNPNTIFVSSNDKNVSSKEENGTNSSNKNHTTSVPYKPIIIALCLVCMSVAVVMFYIGRTSGERGSNLELAKLKSEVTDLRDKNRVSEVMIDNYQKQIYELENNPSEDNNSSEKALSSEEKNKLEKEISSLKTQVNDLTQSNKELNEKVKSNEKLAEEKKKSDNEVSSLKTQVQNLTKTNQELNNKVKSLESTKTTSTYIQPVSNTNTSKTQNNGSTKEVTDNAKVSDIVDITSVKVKKGTPTVWTEYDLTISGVIHSEQEISSIDFTVEAYNANGETVSLANSITYSSAPGPLVKYSASLVVLLNSPSKSEDFSFT